MAKDDMEVIIYKILRYLYDAMKAGKQPQEEDIWYNGRLFKIPKSYWIQIIMEMRDNGLIAGERISITKDGPLVDLSEVRITLAGRQYLEENSRMEAAKRFAGQAFDAVLEAVIKALPTVIQNM